MDEDAEVAFATFVFASDVEGGQTEQLEEFLSCVSQGLVSNVLGVKVAVKVIDTKEQGACNLHGSM